MPSKSEIRRESAQYAVAYADARLALERGDYAAFGQAIRRQIAIIRTQSKRLVERTKALCGSDED
jgi:hypothetical protein